MDKLIVHGGARLEGHVKVSGSKNAALPILVASLLTDEECVFHNVPRLGDIKIMNRLLTYLGKTITRKGSSIRIVSNSSVHKEAPYELVRQMRASALVMGPLVARYGNAKASLPGGCAIGARPIDIHLRGFKALGARIEVLEGYILLKSKKLRGNRIVFDFPSVGATENILMAATLAQGTTIIENAARGPQIVDLASCLSQMGAKIQGAGTSTIQIEGVKKLHGVSYTVIPDRIEAGTFLTAIAMTRGNAFIENARIEHMTALIAKLKEAGVSIKKENGGLHIKVRDYIKPVNIETTAYPGFPTDMQAQWMAFMCTASGSSLVTETVFENRFMHVAEMQRMGARLKIQGNTVFVEGKDNLSGAEVMATDLRASAALVLAGLIANGKTMISRIYHLDRGYEKLEVKLRKLGANIRRVKEINKREYNKYE